MRKCDLNYYVFLLSKLNHKQKLTTSAIWNAAPLFVTASIGIWLLSFAVPRLGLTHYGIYVTMIAAVSPLTMLLCGVPAALIQSVARSIGKNDLPLSIGYAQAGSMLIAIGALLSMFVAALLLPFGSRLLLGTTDPITIAFPLLNCTFAVAASTFIQHLSTVPSSILSAMQRFRALSFCAMTQTVATTILQVLAIQFGFGISGFAWSIVIGSTITLVIKLIVVGVPSGFAWFVPRIQLDVFRELLVFGRWQSVAQLGGLAAAQAERVCITAMLGPAATTSFDLCVKAQTPLYTVVWQAMQSLFPFFSSKSGEGVRQNVYRTMRATWISTVATAMVLIPLGGLSTQIMTLWMGADIAMTAAPIMTVLAFAGVVGSATNAPCQLLLAIGETRTLAIVAILTGVTNVCSAIIVFPTLGIRGAGLPALIAMIVQWVYVNRVISRAGAISFRETSRSSMGVLAAAAMMIGVLKTIEAMLPSSSIVWLTALPGFFIMLGLSYWYFQTTQIGRQGIIDLRDILGVLRSKLQAA